MTGVVSINRETVADFVRREKAVTTLAVAYRFGWTTAEARKHLGALRRRGEVDAEMQKWSCIGGGGRVLVWRAP